MLVGCVSKTATTAATPASQLRTWQPQATMQAFQADACHCCACRAVQENAARYLMEQFAAAPADCAFMCGEMHSAAVWPATKVEPSYISLSSSGSIHASRPKSASVSLATPLLQTMTTTWDLRRWCGVPTCRASQQTACARRLRATPSASTWRPQRACLVQKRCCACWWRSGWKPRPQQDNEVVLGATLCSACNFSFDAVRPCCL